jgi:regulator of replication initiation timing
MKVAIMPEPAFVDIDELKAIDDLEQRLAYSIEEKRDRIEAELQKLRERLNVQFGAKVAEVQQMLEQLADTRAEVGDSMHAEELRKAADKLAEIARRRQVRDL